MLTLPKPLAYTVVRQVALPVMIVLPAGTALLGWLMVNRLVYRHSITALGQKEEQYRLLSENIEAILWEFDIAKNCWTYVAPQVERMLGYSPEEFLDIQFWIDHIDERDRDWASTYCAEAVQRGMSHTFEYRFLKKHPTINRK